MDAQDAAFLRDIERRIIDIAKHIQAGPWIADLAELAGDIAERRAGQPPVPRSCATCRHVFRDSAGDLECRRAPPVPINMPLGTRSAFPRVEPDCRCGEWAEQGAGNVE